MIDNSTIRFILENARNKISNKKNWTKHDFARNKYGDPVSSTDPSAVSWCASGAINAAVYCQPTVRYEDCTLAINESQEYLMRFIDYPIGILWMWHDKPNRTHKEVINAFDRAIAGC